MPITDEFSRLEARLESLQANQALLQAELDTETRLCQAEARHKVAGRGGEGGPAFLPARPPARPPACPPACPPCLPQAEHQRCALLLNSLIYSIFQTTT